jgi:hypothetical protein
MPNPPTILHVSIFLLCCTACGQSTQSSESQGAGDSSREVTARELQVFESNLRLSVYFECGGDEELRCQQFGPDDLRGIRPTIPLGGLQCKEVGNFGGRVRTCSFVLGGNGGATSFCNVRMHEAVGIHSPYWTDELPPVASVKNTSDRNIPSFTVGRSSLTCNTPLLALTAEPEKVDPSPTIGPQIRGNWQELIAEIERVYSSPRDWRGGTTVVRLRVGSHGRIDRCKIEQASGLERMEQEVCQQLRTRAWFDPARDKIGNAVAAEITQRLVWESPPKL